MNALKHLALAMCAIAAPFAIHAQETNETEKTETVYIFGVGASFQDSTVYFTDVQTLEGTKLIEKGFLLGRTMYAYQLKGYLENALNLPNRTCAIYFSDKKKKIEKTYAKLKAKYENDETIKLNFTGYGEFKFERVN